MQQVSDQETKIILDYATKALKIEGDFVELGCYKGDTSLELAKLLKNSHTDKALYLYDSFAGLPEKSPEDSSVAGDQFKQGELDCSKSALITRFKKANLPLPYIKKAFFEDLNPHTDLPEKIAFAFLDGDLYASIKTSFTLIEPHLTKDTIILVHDYNNPALPGVAKAVDQYLKAAGQGRRLSVHETLAIIC